MKYIENIGYMYLQTPSKTNGSHNLWKTTKASQKFVVHFFSTKTNQIMDNCLSA